MPTISPDLIYDANASENGIYSSTNTQLQCGSNSAIVNAQFALLFNNVQLKQGQKVAEALLTITGVSNLNSSTLIVAIGAQKTVNASQPSSGSDIIGRTMTTARVAYTFTGATAKAFTFDIATVIQEIVNQAGWQPGNDILFQIRPTGGSGGGNGNGGRRLDFYSSESANPPTLSITTTLPPVTATMTPKQSWRPKLAMSVSAEAPEPPEPVVLQAQLEQSWRVDLLMNAARGDPSKNTLFKFERLPAASHAFVTGEGELLPFVASFDETLGGVRTEMLGSGDEAWYPASGLLTRTPEALTFRATLIEASRRDSDRFVRLLEDAERLVLPSGKVWDLYGADHAARPQHNVLELVALPTGAYPRHPLLSGNIQAAFETFDSTPELPVYAIDPAGGISSPVLSESWDTGFIAFGVRIGERTRQSLVSLGTPIAADGSVPEGSLAVSWDRNALLISLRGEQYRINEVFLGTFGAVLVCVLRWTRHSATLTTVSNLGLRTWTIEIGAPRPLSENVLSAGQRSDGVGSGAYLAFGSPFLSVKPGTIEEAEDAARELYAELVKPNRSWEVRPPNISLEVTRVDEGNLELAPGESRTFELAVRRVGGYSGNLDFEVSADRLTTSYSVTRLEDVDTYKVTLTAPLGTPEAPYTLRATVKAAGADNPGSILENVRSTFDAIVQVAAGPAIAPNATALYFANDPVQKRDAQMLADASGNANTLFWEGLARPNREFTALFSTGVYGAHVRSGTLANPTQAQRMGANQTFSLILGEVDKAKDGTLFHARAENSDNGVSILKSGNGFKLKTLLNGANVTSLNTLTWRGGRARLLLIAGAMTITLLDRDSGLSISLARPAWADDGVRTHLGANRANNGALSSLCRAYCYAWSAHPYALSDIQGRRNMDALQAYAPKSDGRGEFADNALGVVLFNDDTAELVGQKYRNFAAPALNIQAVPVGTVKDISGGIQTTGADDSHVYINTGVPSGEVVTMLTTILDFATPKEYTAQVAFNDSNSSTGNATLTRHASRQAFFMESKNRPFAQLQDRRRPR